jgi:hypothetical protein
VVRPMYRKPKFLNLLHEIRQQMARECDYDTDLFVQGLRGESPGVEAQADPTSPKARKVARQHRTKRAEKE